jgi:hypothetical protein
MSEALSLNRSDISDTSIQERLLSFGRTARSHPSANTNNASTSTSTTQQRNSNRGLTHDPEHQACVQEYFQLKSHPAINDAYADILCAWLGVACPWDGDGTTGGTKLDDLTDSTYREFNAATETPNYEQLRANYELACVVAGGTYCREEYTLDAVPKPFAGNPDAPRFAVTTKFKEVPLCKPRNRCHTKEMIPMAIAEIQEQMSDWADATIDNYIRCHEYTTTQLDALLDLADTMGLTEFYSQTYEDAQHDTNTGGYVVKRPAMGFDPNLLEHKQFGETAGARTVESIRVTAKGAEQAADGTYYSSGESGDGGGGGGVKMAFVGSGITVLVAMFGLGWVVLTKRYKAGPSPPSSQPASTHKRQAGRRRRKQPTDDKDGDGDGDDETWDKEWSSSTSSDLMAERRDVGDSSNTVSTPSPRFMLERLQSYKQKMNLLNNNNTEQEARIHSLAQAQSSTSTTRGANSTKQHNNKRHDLGIHRARDGGIEVQLPPVQHVGQVQLHERSSPRPEQQQQQDQQQQQQQQQQQRTTFDRHQAPPSWPSHANQSSSSRTRETYEL